VVYLNFISLSESGYPKGGFLKYSQIPPGEWHDGTDSQLITETTHRASSTTTSPNIKNIYIHTHT